MRDPIRSARLRIHDMLDNIGYVREATAGLTLETFLKQRIVQLATERAIGIISEASRHVPDEMKETQPDIPWRKIAGIGNVLRHDYRNVAAPIIWNLIQNDFASLELALRRILVEIGEE